MSQCPISALRRHVDYFLVARYQPGTLDPATADGEPLTAHKK